MKKNNNSQTCKLHFIPDKITRTMRTVLMHVFNYSSSTTILNKINRVLIFLIFIKKNNTDEDIMKLTCLRFQYTHADEYPKYGEHVVQ